jgi:hypothetical protein
MESKDQILRELKQLSDQANLLFINVNEMRNKVMELHTDNLQKELAKEKETTQELRDVNDDLMFQNEGLIDEIDQLTIQILSNPFHSATEEKLND